MPTGLYEISTIFLNCRIGRGCHPLLWLTCIAERDNVTLVADFFPCSFLPGSLFRRSFCCQEEIFGKNDILNPADVCDSSAPKSYRHLIGNMRLETLIRCSHKKQTSKKLFFFRTMSLIGDPPPPSPLGIFRKPNAKFTFDLGLKPPPLSKFRLT